MFQFGESMRVDKLVTKIIKWFQTVGKIGEM